MKFQKAISTLGFALAFSAPLATFASDLWESTNDEAGSRIVTQQFGTPSAITQVLDATPVREGDISIDRQYVFLGEEGGWQPRPMQYRFEGGRLVHVDDPAGHMDRLADNSPLTEQARNALTRGGS